MKADVRCGNLLRKLMRVIFWFSISSVAQLYSVFLILGTLYALVFLSYGTRDTASASTRIKVTLMPNASTDFCQFVSQFEMGSIR